MKTVFFFVVIVTSGWCDEAADIMLRPQAAVRGSIVLLSDLAEVRGGDAERLAALRRTELFPAPAPGQSRAVRAGEVQELLRLNGYPPSSFLLSGARLVQITSVARPPAITAQPPRSASEQATARLVVARRALSPGEVIRLGDVELLPPNSPTRDLMPLRELEEAVGMQVMRPVAAGQPLDARLLKRPLAIRRGETVVVFSRAPGVCVRGTAKAVEDASVGDLVILESLGNRRRFSARVTGNQQADVYASGTWAGTGGHVSSAAAGRARPGRAME